MAMWPFHNPHREFIDHLRDEVEYWRRLYREERARAETAINLVLARAAQSPGLPVNLPPREPTEEEKRIEALLNDPEFTKAGVEE